MADSQWYLLHVDEDASKVESATRVKYIKAGGDHVCVFS
jgi:hypothetical protein